MDTQTTPARIVPRNQGPQLDNAEISSSQRTERKKLHQELSQVITNNGDDCRIRIMANDRRDDNVVCDIQEHSSNRDSSQSLSSVSISRNPDDQERFNEVDRDVVAEKVKCMIAYDEESDDDDDSTEEDPLVAQVGATKRKDLETIEPVVPLNATKKETIAIKQDFPMKNEKKFESDQSQTHSQRGTPSTHSSLQAAVEKLEDESSNGEIDKIIESIPPLRASKSHSQTQLEMDASIGRIDDTTSAEIQNLGESISPFSPNGSLRKVITGTFQFRRVKSILTVVKTGSLNSSDQNQDLTTPNTSNENNEPTPKKPPMIPPKHNVANTSKTPGCTDSTKKGPIVSNGSASKFNGSGNNNSISEESWKQDAFLRNAVNRNKSKNSENTQARRSSFFTSGGVLNGMRNGGDKTENQPDNVEWWQKSQENYKDSTTSNNDDLEDVVSVETSLSELTMESRIRVVNSMPYSPRVIIPDVLQLKKSTRRQSFRFLRRVLGSSRSKAGNSMQVYPEY